MTDYNFSVIIGVKIDVSSAYISGNKEIDPRCEHAKTSNDPTNFCSVCGKEIKRPYPIKACLARKDLIKALGFNIECADEGNDLIEWNCYAETGYDFISYNAYSNNPSVWCGTIIGGFFVHKQDGYNKEESVPEILPKELLFTFLDNLELKYKEEDYGVWSICEGL